ncbi:MAG TPA: glutaredoxin domain-containing protein [Ktedonobacterales bacterium]|jgi:mycoredoxin
MSETIGTSDIRFYSTTWCGDCRRSRKVFQAMGVGFEDIDIEEHPEAAEIVRKANHGMQSVPTIIFPDGTVLVEPSNATLEQKLSTLLSSTK